MANFDKKFVSAEQEWETPQSLFNKLNAEFNFEWDLAAPNDNTKCKKFYTKEDNGLVQRWNGVCWLNPHYGERGNRISDWVKKAYTGTQNNANCTVVMLIPARTNTIWFHKYCMKAAELRFICGRPKFGGAKYGLPQPLVIVVFRKSSNLIVSSFYL